RQISIIRVWTKVIDLGRTTDNNGFAHENFIFRPVVAIDGKHILSPLVVALLKGFHTDRDKLASIRRGTGRFGKPLDIRRPQQVLLSLDHTVDITFYIVIITNGNPTLIVFKCKNTFVIVFFTPFCSFGRRDKVLEPFILYVVWIFHEKLYLMNALLHDPCKE